MVEDDCLSGQPQHGSLLAALLPRLLKWTPEASNVDAVGHRVVHGGAMFVDPTVLDDSVMRRLENTIPLAPLHTPGPISLAWRRAWNCFPMCLKWPSLTPRFIAHCLREPSTTPCLNLWPSGMACGVMAFMASVMSLWRKRRPIIFSGRCET